MAFFAINMTLENRRDFGAIAMLLHMVLACAGAVLIFCYFVIRNLLEELYGLLQKHYSTVYVESVFVLGVSMILIHGYGVKVRAAQTNYSRPIAYGRIQRGGGVEPLPPIIQFCRENCIKAEMIKAPKFSLAIHRLDWVQAGSSPNQKSRLRHWTQNSVSIRL